MPNHDITSTTLEKENNAAFMSLSIAKLSR